MVLGGDADARIGDRHGQAAGPRVAGDRDADVALVRELEGVRQQVEDDLLHLLAIAVQHGRPRRQVEVHRQADAPHDRLELRDHLADHLAHVDRAEPDRHAAGLDARDVEALVDDRQQVLAVGVDAREVLVLRLRERAGDALAEHLRVPEDRVERRAELVRDVGQELRLCGGGLLDGEVLPPQHLVLLDELGGRRLDLGRELRRRGLELRVEARLVERLAPVVEDGDDRLEVAARADHLAGHGLHRQGVAGRRRDEGELAAEDCVTVGQQPRDERRSARRWRRPGGRCPGRCAGRPGRARPRDRS